MQPLRGAGCTSVSCSAGGPPPRAGARTVLFLFSSSFPLLSPSLPLLHGPPLPFAHGSSFPFLSHIPNCPPVPFLVLPGSPHACAQQVQQVNSPSACAHPRTHSLNPPQTSSSQLRPFPSSACPIEYSRMLPNDLAPKIWHRGSSTEDLAPIRPDVFYFATSATPTISRKAWHTARFLWAQRFVSWSASVGFATTFRQSNKRRGSTGRSLQQHPSILEKAREPPCITLGRPCGT